MHCVRNRILPYRYYGMRKTTPTELYVRIHGKQKAKESLECHSMDTLLSHEAKGEVL